MAELVKLDDSNFRKLFSGSPVKRIGRDRFVRNVLIAIGNSGDRNLAADAQALLEDSSAQVRAMAVWAVQELSSTEATDRLGKEHRKNETDQNVLAEWSTSI